MKLCAAAALALMATATPALSAEVVINMKNSDPSGKMVFAPAYVKAAVGDTIHFVAADKGHNAQVIPGMLPDGVQAPPSAINKDYKLVVSKPGLYGVRCAPHYGLGMVALIKAGNGPAPNAAAANAVAGKMSGVAKTRMVGLLAAAK